MTSCDTDIFAITETWLGSSIDKCVIAELVSNGYGIHHSARLNRRAGGVAIILQLNLVVKPIQRKKMATQFELLECSMQSSNHTFLLFVIYCPRPSKINQLKTSTFFEEGWTFLTIL